ncbi:MAG TPA: hypothetical protein VGR89_05100 [Puia sp.]|nr:hypothetical protein [Puia sp.]
MQKNLMQHNVRRTRIYKDIYRPSSNPSRFFGTILSVLLHGHSQVGNQDFNYPRGKGR